MQDIHRVSCYIYLSKNVMNNKGEILIYQSEDNQATVEVRLEKNTVWLTQEQMSYIFEKDRTVIT